MIDRDIIVSHRDDLSRGALRRLWMVVDWISRQSADQRRHFGSRPFSFGGQALTGVPLLKPIISPDDYAWIKRLVSEEKYFQ